MTESLESRVQLSSNGLLGAVLLESGQFAAATSSPHQDHQQSTALFTVSFSDSLQQFLSDNQNGTTYLILEADDTTDAIAAIDRSQETDTSAPYTIEFLYVNQADQVLDHSLGLDIGEWSREVSQTFSIQSSSDALSQTLSADVLELTLSRSTGSNFTAYTTASFVPVDDGDAAVSDSQDAGADQVSDSIVSADIRIALRFDSASNHVIADNTPTQSVTLGDSSNDVLLPDFAPELSANDTYSTGKVSRNIDTRQLLSDRHAQVHLDASPEPTQSISTSTASVPAQSFSTATDGDNGYVEYRVLKSNDSGLLQAGVQDTESCTQRSDSIEADNSSQSAIRSIFALYETHLAGLIENFDDAVSTAPLQQFVDGSSQLAEPQSPALPAEAEILKTLGMPAMDRLIEQVSDSRFGVPLADQLMSSWQFLFGLALFLVGRDDRNGASLESNGLLPVDQDTGLDPDSLCAPGKFEDIRFDGFHIVVDHVDALTNSPGRFRLETQGDSRIVSAPVHGEAVVNTDGTLTYKANPGFAGVDSMTVEIASQNQRSPMMVVTFDVMPGELAEETDSTTPDGTEFVAKPSHGQVTWAEDGTFEYLPNPGFVGVDSFLFASRSVDTAQLTQVTVEVRR